MKFKFGEKYTVEDENKHIDNIGKFVAVITDIPFGKIICLDYSRDEGLSGIDSLKEIIENMFEDGYMFEILGGKIVGFDSSKQTIDIEVNADASLTIIDPDYEDFDIFRG